MPRQTKSKTESDATSAVPAVVQVAPVVKKEKKVSAEKTVAPVTTSTPVVQTASTTSEKPVKVKAEKSKAPVTTSTPVVQVVSAPVEAVSSEDSALAAVGDIEASIAAQSAEFLSKLNQLTSIIASLKTEYKSLEKKWSRELKAAQKSGSKKRKRVGNRAPSGFVKPTRISDELASFLGKDKGTEMARTDVTREINMYIRSHNLQDKENGRKINPDSKLKDLLKLKGDDELTYFNLQRFMSPHFQKTGDVATVSA
jgi:chromatin remodeling complex protein RSC6